jgi:hypothetical protein
MAEASIAAKFEAELPAALNRLAQDEWAVTTLRNALSSTASPEEAFASVSPVLRLAGVQHDPYALVSCCWFALDLARRSGTTEVPLELPTLLAEAKLRARGLNCEAEVANVAAWYRLAI